MPVNTTATIHLPAAKGALITEGGKPVLQVKGIRVVESGENESVFEVGSGSYSFSVSETAKLR